MERCPVAVGKHGGRGQTPPRWGNDADRLVSCGRAKPGQRLGGQAKRDGLDAKRRALRGRMPGRRLSADAIDTERERRSLEWASGPRSGCQGYYGHDQAPVIIRINIAIKWQAKARYGTAEVAELKRRRTRHPYSGNGPPPRRQPRGRWRGAGGTWWTRTVILLSCIGNPRLTSVPRSCGEAIAASRLRRSSIRSGR